MIPRVSGRYIARRMCVVVGVASLATYAALGVAAPGLATGDPLFQPAASEPIGGVVSLRRQTHVPRNGQLRGGEVLSHRLRPQTAGWRWQWDTLRDAVPLRF